ncbi:MAG: 3-carboxy-cis,cis-muconate cycloisomerase [Polaromonas sp.]|nr:3-carboxy-cis,cis-muconate cycloisomerase [Polaromonas sp.]
MSSILEGFLATPEVLELFGERRFLEAMLRFEAALARAQASAGLIPAAAAQSIIGTCQVELFDVAKIVRESVAVGSIAVPLLKSLKETVGLFNEEAGGYVHLGSTSQDVVDTALALVTRDALGLIMQDVRKAVGALLALAGRHAADPVLARTFMQPASVTSFGLKCAGWSAPLVRSLQRLQCASAQALSVQLGGAVGTLAEMKKGDKHLGPQVHAFMAADLGLRQAPFAWHTQRDEWVALGCEVAVLAGSLGKLAKDLSLMVQYEVGEVAEPLAPARGGSSVMPHKRNPVLCMVALSAAQRAPQRAAALLAAMPQEHERALGNWQAELAEWPGLLMCAHGAARAMAQAVSGLQVDTQRMRGNLDAVRSELPPDIADAWFAPALANHAATLARAQVALQHAALAALDARPQATPEPA